MTQTDPATCPLCGQPNRCAMTAGAACSDCWCARITIDESVLARVPQSAVGVACICENCASGQPATPDTQQESAPWQTNRPGA